MTHTAVHTREALACKLGFELPCVCTVALSFFFAVSLLLSGCATVHAPLPQVQSASTGPAWSGKINLTLESEPRRAFSADFDLQGSPGAGAMQFYTRLGTTLGGATWDEHGARLLIPNQADQTFESLNDLSQKWLGAPLPLEMIFSWANEQSPAPTVGWSVVQTTPAQGDTPSFLHASRQSPLPQVQLRVWLVRAHEE